MLSGDIRTPLKRGVNDNPAVFSTVTSSKSINTHRDEKHSANKRVALEKSAVDSDQIAFLCVVFVKKSGGNQRKIITR